ncbi:hypothetical protein EGW08_012999 [Elysia chlorotica]|uniref:Uncharacterized protein n=1 Tax=Elysia chlorotica TaxID=188477 RepID=A0A433TCR4_ELYCH|nr:hypothetical protein EGW08_012999 [Elysia chlorotica]
MEFIRHFLIYMSHLLLYTYSWELPQRHLYTESQTYNMNTSMFSVFVALLGAAPTFFIFGVVMPQHNVINQVVLRSNKTAWTFVDEYGASCHLVTNIASTTQTYDTKGLTWIYFLMPVVIYSVCLYWYIANLIGYLQYRDFSQKSSIFLTKLEDVLLFDSATNNVPGASRAIPHLIFTSGANGSDQTYTNQQMQRNSLAAFGFITAATSPSGKAEIVAMPSYRVAYGDKKDKLVGIIRDGRDSESTNSSTSSANSFIDHCTGGGLGTNDGKERDNNNSGKDDKTVRMQSTISFIESAGADIQRIRERRGTGLFPRMDDVNNRTSASTDSNDTDLDESNYPRISIKESDTDKTKYSKGPFRSILAKEKSFGPKLYPRVGSYKKSLAAMILADLIIIPLVMFVYILTGANSVVLNMVHLKTIFSFYVLSVINPSLRRCVWGRRCPMCPPFSDNEPNKPSILRPSMLQVRFVRERLRAKHEDRRMRHQARMIHSMTGTQI